MKAVKTITTGLVCGTLAMMSVASNSMAAVTCTSATITQIKTVAWEISTVASSHYFYATCEAGDETWATERYFFIKKFDTTDAMLATALTAVSLDKKVALLLGSSTSGALAYTINLQR